MYMLLTDLIYTEHIRVMANEFSLVTLSLMKIIIIVYGHKKFALVATIYQSVFTIQDFKYVFND